MLFGLSYLKLGIGLAVLLLVAGGAFAIKSGVNKIARQGAQIEALKTDLAAEKAARERDVIGLTVLAQGVIDASSARALDEQALGETIDASNPKPVSPELGALLDRFRVPAGANPGAAAPAAGHPR